MNSPKSISLVATCGALVLFGGCASEPASHLVTAPPPGTPPQTVMVTPAAQQVVVTAPGQVVGTVVTPGQGNSYIVVQAPPAPQAAEAVPTRPTSQHVWIPGFWTWQANRYAWMAGHWEVPPYSGATWVNPRWEPESGAFRFYEGRWN